MQTLIATGILIFNSQFKVLFLTIIVLYL